MTLDELENDRTPRFVRMVSREPKDGYIWNPYFEHYEEGDALFRARIVASMASLDYKAGLLTQLRDLGIREISEEIVGPCHFRLTVDDEHVEAVKQIVYDCMPITYRVDVAGRSTPQAG